MLLLSIAMAHADTKSDLISKGEQLAKTYNCADCHTNKQTAIKTSHGILYAPNITADRETGIGNWSDEDFSLAMRKSIAPDGSSYYPLFRTSHPSELTTADLKALKAYLLSLPAVYHPVMQNKISWPYRTDFIKWLSRKLSVTDTGVVLTESGEPGAEVVLAAEAYKAPNKPMPKKLTVADGKKIYETKTCHLCHEGNRFEAPQLSDKAAWLKITGKKNFDVIFKNVIRGHDKMPPRGACQDCSEEELKAATKYLLQQGTDNAKNYELW